MMVGKFKEELNEHLDPYQFAYQNDRGTDGTVLTVVHGIVKHLEDRSAYARLFFLDLRSAFNTLQPHLMLSVVSSMSVNPYSIKRLQSVLPGRTQQVKVNQTLSEANSLTLVPPPTTTTPPQWCACSPLLFKLFCKFLEDTAILDLLHKDKDIRHYTTHVVKNTVL